MKMNITKILLGAAVLIAAPAVSGAGEARAQNAPQEPIVVETPMVHDPVMAYENGKYYLYCTGHGIAQMTSTDRRHWTLSDSRTNGIWLIPVPPLARTHLPSVCSATPPYLIRMAGRTRAALLPLKAIETTGMPSTLISSLMRRETLGLPGVLSGMASS